MLTTLLANLGERLDDIVETYRKALHLQIEERKTEMQEDAVDHLTLYRVLGFTDEEGKKVDLYQNIGRFLYKYAGSLIEDLTKEAIKETKGGSPISIVNSISTNPKNFDIDWYVKSDNKAHEIKWRDATTDGDHIRKEHDKLKAIVKAGMLPIKVMFFMPSRDQAFRIQEKIIAAYTSYGESYVGAEAFDYIKDYTKFDLFQYLEKKAADSKKLMS